MNIASIHRYAFNACSSVANEDPEQVGDGDAEEGV
jgi:hypothetical protein